MVTIDSTKATQLIRNAVDNLITALMLMPRGDGDGVDDPEDCVTELQAASIKLELATQAIQSPTGVLNLTDEEMEQYANDPEIEDLLRNQE
jgi:hypothetical protein